MVPLRHGEELYELVRSRKLLVCPKEMEHNTNLLMDVGYFVLPMLQFLRLSMHIWTEVVPPRILGCLLFLQRNLMMVQGKFVRKVKKEKSI